MTDNEDVRRKKVIYMTDELLRLLFQHPDNYYVHDGIPDGTNYVSSYSDEERMAVGLVMQNDDWDVVPEGSKFPRLEVDVRKINCKKCSQRMLYDEENDRQYCPKCHQRWHP